jgi:hypothetical protein
MDYSESRSLGPFRPQRRPQLRGSRSSESITICRALPRRDRFNTQGVSCRRFGPYNTKCLRRGFNVSAEAPASLAPMNVKSKKLPFWNAVSIGALTVVAAILYVYSAFLLSLWLLKHNKIRMGGTTARRSRQPTR